MDKWTSQSKPGKQLALAVASCLLGLVLLIGFRGFGTSGTNAMAGFALGALLLLIGAAGLLVSGTQTIVVDPRARHITVVDSNRFGTKKRVIPFGDIIDIGIGYAGKKSNYVSFYYLVLKLKSGQDYPLFAPGRFFEGASNRSIVEGWRTRLEAFLTRQGDGR